MLGKIINLIKSRPALGLLVLITGPDLVALTEFGTYKWGISPGESKKNNYCQFYLEGSNKTLSGKREQYLNGICPLEAIAAKAFSRFLYNEGKLARVEIVAPLNSQSVEKFKQAAKTTYKEALEGHPRGDKPLKSAKKALKEIDELKAPMLTPADLVKLLERAWGKAPESNLEHLATIAKASSHQMIGLFWSEGSKAINKTAAITMTDEGVLTLVIQYFHATDS